MHPTRVLGAALLLLAALPLAARADLPESASEIRPLLVGSEIPDTPLETSEGQPTTLHAAVGDGPAVIVFYRGGW